jgi:hypothetical protein
MEMNMGRLRRLVVLLVLFRAAPGFSQTPDSVRTLFSRKIGLNDAEIAQIEQGRGVAKILNSPRPSQVLVFGAVYIATNPGKFLALANDLNRHKLLPGNRAVRRFSDPPVVSDMSGLVINANDVKELKACKPGDCDLQLPAGSMDQFRKKIDWSSADPAAQVNRLTKEMVVQALQAYQKGGNAALGAYEDKDDPIHVAKQFSSLVESAKAFSLDLPALYAYILNYPKALLPNSSNLFYWENIEFGLKPTFRVNQQVAVHMNAAIGPVDVVAIKQIYASHYFQTALDLYLCIPRSSSGFYLVTVKGSEQDGLTGLKGRVVREMATSKTKSALETYLAATKKQLEH